MRYEVQRYKLRMRRIIAWGAVFEIHFAKLNNIEVSGQRAPLSEQFYWKAGLFI